MEIHAGLFTLLGLPREVTSPGATEDGLDSEQLLDLHEHSDSGAGRPRSRLVCRSKESG